MKNINPLHNQNETAGQKEALEIIKSRIRELYDDEPEMASTKARPKSELIDKFWQEHKDHHDPQAAWQLFYEGLGDEEKVSLWDEYHSINSDADTKGPKVSLDRTKEYGTYAIPGVSEEQVEPMPAQSAATFDEAPLDIGHSASFEKPKKSKAKEKAKKLTDKQAMRKRKEQLIKGVKRAPRLNAKKSRRHWAPFLISLSVGLLILFAQYNPLIFALAKQYISPGDTLRSPVIIDPNADINVGQESKIIIPKINVDVPVVYDVTTKDEKAIQDALERGVVHYDGTSVPGKAGNNVIVGHSSNNFLNSGKYKFAFVLLDRLELNDTFILHYEGTRYVYKVTNKQVIEPTDFSLTLPTAKPTATLITCTPPGTSWKRLVIQGEQISPALNKQQTQQQPPAETVETAEDAIVPGNAPSLWQRFTDWLF